MEECSLNIFVNISFCVSQKKKICRSGIKRGWVNDDRTYIFIPLKHFKSFWGNFMALFMALAIGKVVGTLLSFFFFFNNSILCTFQYIIQKIFFKGMNFTELKWRTLYGKTLCCLKYFQVLPAEVWEYLR